jgi:hypothetical protein
MILLSNYDEYIVELKLTESLRNFPLFLSNRLRKMLSQIDHEIAKELLDRHSDTDTKVKQTFVDVHDEKPDTITFIQPNKVVQIIGLDDDIKDDQDLENIDKDPIYKEFIVKLTDNNDVYKKSRSETRWGRFINSAFPGKYQQSLPGGQNKKDIESFVNLYKSLYDRKIKFPMIDVVNGMDIAKWYHCDNYYDDDDGSLGESCMSRKDEEYFELYTSNPNEVSLIIMYGDISKSNIKARALLWKLDSPSGRMFMDRVYTNDYSDEQIFIDYAKQNNWLYKSRQGMGSDISIIDPSIDESRNLIMMVELHPEDYSLYPYLDTMTYYNPSTGKISNKYGIYNAKYELTDTGGGTYEAPEYDEEPEWVYSNYHGEEIDKNHSKYCVFGDDWVREDDAIRVWNSSEWGSGQNYAVPGNEEIVHSKFEIPGENTYNKYFPKKKCIWSDHLNTWLFNEGAQTGAKKVWTDLERKNFVLDHSKRLDKTFKEINGEYWSMDLFNDNGLLIGEISPLVTSPVGTPPRGWHRMLKYVDDNGNIFVRGQYYGKEE